MNFRNYSLFSLATCLLVTAIASIVISFRRYDALLLTSIFPIVWSAYRFDRRIYIPLCAYTVLASSIAVTYAFKNPRFSYQTITVSALTLMALCESIHRVVMKRNELEAKLRQSEERFSQIALHIDQAIWLANDTHFLYLSPAHARVWGREWRSFPVPRRELMSCIVEDDRARVEQWLQNPSMRADQIEYRIQRADGAIRVIRDKGFPFPGEARETRRIAGIAEDVTAQRQIERELEQARKIEGLGRLAASVAHDFNNVLTVIQSYSFALKQANYLRAEHENAVTEIQVAAERGHVLTKGILAFTRMQPPERKLCDLNEIVKGLIGTLLGLLDKSISLKFQACAGPLLVNVDRSMIEQAVTNLVANARDAMPEGGMITLVTSCADAEPAPLAPQKRFASFSIADTGVGMSPETRARLFQPFFTTKPLGKGTGLGLATVNRLVKEHDGAIQVESEIGQGSTFTILLPIQAGTLGQDRSARGPDTEIFIAERGTILLIEDDPQIRNLSRQLLSSYGYNVLECRSGVSALKAWREDRDRICLVITDVTLADGFSGVELAKQLQSDQRSIPVLFTGSGLPPATAEWTFNSELLPKPFEAPALLKAVKRLLKQQTKTLTAASSSSACGDWALDPSARASQSTNRFIPNSLG